MASLLCGTGRPPPLSHFTSSLSALFFQLLCSLHCPAWVAWPSFFIYLMQWFIPYVKKKGRVFLYFLVPSKQPRLVTFFKKDTLIVEFLPFFSLKLMPCFNDFFASEQVTNIPFSKLPLVDILTPWVYFSGIWLFFEPTYRSLKGL